MISWLPVIILSYLFFSLAFFGDKLILSGPPNPKLYAFYVGMLSLVAVIFIPFIKFTLPNPQTFLWIILGVIVYLLGLYSMFVALSKFDVSRVMTTIGAVQPIFILILTWLFWAHQAVSGINLIAFFLLLAGSIIISVEKKIKLPVKYGLLIIFSSLMFSLQYIFSKLVFLSLPFLSGLVWMGIFTFLFALVFLFDSGVRKQIFSKKVAFNKKIGVGSPGTELEFAL